MPEPKTEPKPERSDKDDVVKQTQGDSLTPEQKHANYLKTIERLHNEP